MAVDVVSLQVIQMERPRWTAGDEAIRMGFWRSPRMA
jgi:hypothetical protein